MDADLLDRIRSARAVAPGGPAAAPPHSDAVIAERTGRGWDAWLADVHVALGADPDHAAIAAWVRDQGVDGWWAQAVAVGVERLSGRRLAGQQPDGTFSISRSRATSVDREALHARIGEGSFPGLEAVRRSRPGAKALRFTLTDAGAPVGSLLLSLDAYGARPRLTATHDRIAGPVEAELWKDYWAAWLAAVEEEG